uniref:Uncharacterized protein n=1 Tax=Solanum tuberosum TaxID=4113 RepID=M1DAS5_SOLTU
MVDLEFGIPTRRAEMREIVRVKTPHYPMAEKSKEESHDLNLAWCMRRSNSFSEINGLKSSQAKRPRTSGKNPEREDSSALGDSSLDSRKHRYVARELVRKEVGKSRRPGIPSALSGAGRQTQNFRVWLGAL